MSQFRYMIQSMLYSWKIVQLRIILKLSFKKFYKLDKPHTCRARF